MDIMYRKHDFKSEFSRFFMYKYVYVNANLLCFEKEDKNAYKG